MIPRSEVTHDRSLAVADAVGPGDLVEVQILEMKDVVPSKAGGSTKKITLSLKALADDPWAKLDLTEDASLPGPSRA